MIFLYGEPGLMVFRCDEARAGKLAESYPGVIYFFAELVPMED